MHNLVNKSKQFMQLFITFLIWISINISPQFQLMENDSSKVILLKEKEFPFGKIHLWHTINIMLIYCSGHGIQK